MRSVLVIGLLLALSIFLGYRLYLCEPCPDVLKVKEPVQIDEKHQATDTTLVPVEVIPNFSDETGERVKSSKKASKKASKKTVNSRENYYIPKEGENLYRIALKFNTTWERLMELNPFLRNPDDIKAKVDEIYIGTVEERYVPPVTGKQDSVYKYVENYGNDTLGAEVTTVSSGRLISQSVNLRSLPTYIEVEKSKFLVGGGLGTDLSISGGVMYQGKNDVIYNVEGRINAFSPPSINAKVYVPIKFK